MHHYTMQTNNDYNKRTERPDANTTVIPVIQEEVKVDVQTVDTASIVVQKKVSEEQVTVNIPLLQETYEVERIPVNRIVDAPPSVREEGYVTIIPVIREVVVKRYEIVEEVHVIKKQSTTSHSEEITVKKEEVQINRKPLTKE